MPEEPRIGSGTDTKESRERTRPVLRSMLTTSVVTLLVIFAIVDGPVRTLVELLLTTGPRAGIGEAIVRTALLCVACSVVVASIRTDRRTARERCTNIAKHANSDRRIASPEVDSDDGSLVDDLFDSAIAARTRYFDETISLFSSMLVNEKCRTRIVERVGLDRNRAVKTTRIDYAIAADDKEAILLRAGEPLPPVDAEIADQSDPAATGPTHAPHPAGIRSAILVVPLMLVRKGSLLAALDIHSSDGKRLSPLAQTETRGLTAVALSSYFELAFGEVLASDSDSPNQREVRYTPVADACLWKLRRIALRPGEVPREQAEKEFDDAVLPLTANVQNKHSLQKLRELCIYFSDSYFLACEVPVPDGFFVSVEIETDYSMFDPPVTWDRRIRRFFGMEPIRYSIDLDIAHHTRNYHAQLDALDSQQYVHRHFVRDQENNTEIDNTYFTSGRQGLVIYKSDPDRVAPRVNLQDFRGQTRPRLSWEIFVEEVPPGTLAPVLSLSTAAMLLSFCFAFITASTATPEFDAAALVVALPLFVVTFFGFSFDKMTRSSVAGVFLFVMSSVLIVVSSLLVLVSSSESFGIVHTPILLGFWRIADFNGLLIACSMAQLVISLTLIFLIVRRVQRYRTVTKQGYPSSHPAPGRSEQS